MFPGRRRRHWYGRGRHEDASASSSAGNENDDDDDDEVDDGILEAVDKYFAVTLAMMLMRVLPLLRRRRIRLRRGYQPEQPRYPSYRKYGGLGLVVVFLLTGLTTTAILLWQRYRHVFSRATTGIIPIPDMRTSTTETHHAEDGLSVGSVLS